MNYREEILEKGDERFSEVENKIRKFLKDHDISYICCIFNLISLLNTTGVFYDKKYNKIISHEILDYFEPLLSADAFDMLFKQIMFANEFLKEMNDDKEG